MAARRRSCPSCATSWTGAERAHSIVVNPHKWLFTPMDLSVFYTRRAGNPAPGFLAGAGIPEDGGGSAGCQLHGLRGPVGPAIPRAEAVVCDAEFRARRSLRASSARTSSYAQKLADLIRSHPDFEIAAPTPFSLVCFRYRGSDDDNRALLEKINASGKAFLSHTVLNGRFVLRLAIGNMATRWEDLEEVWGW